MKVGVVLEEESGLKGIVCQHFGQCKFFLLADINKDTKKISNVNVVPNLMSHGGGGCKAADEILKHKITHMIAGGMGMGAQAKLSQAGVQVYGYNGKVADALNELINNTLGGLPACKEHGSDCH